MIDAGVKILVRQRASFRCEYCRLPESAAEISFHVEHIMARQHGGTDDLSNLALACDRCNLHKGTNLSGIDSSFGTVAPLFNPRSDPWFEHFQFVGARIEGLTATGRATVRLLQMNAMRRIQLRTRFLIAGLHVDMFTNR
jgi:hypothetical protein